MLCALVYRYFKEVIKCADFPARVKEGPQPYTPLRWFAFWISSWEADKECLSLLWLVWLISHLDVMWWTFSLDVLPRALQFKACFTKLAVLLPEISFRLLYRWMYIWNIFEGLIHSVGRRYSKLVAKNRKERKRFMCLCQWCKQTQQLPLGYPESLSGTEKLCKAANFSQYC